MRNHYSHDGKPIPPDPLWVETGTPAFPKKIKVKLTKKVMRKSFMLCDHCTPARAFHHFHASKAGECHSCKMKKRVAAIPKRYFKRELKRETDK